MDEDENNPININDELEEIPEQTVHHRKASPTNLTTDEIMAEAQKPFWKRVRIVLIALIALSFIGMMIALIVLVVVNPICSVPNNYKWFHNIVFYNIFVVSFYDSDGDGWGDLKGIISKLGYLKNMNVSAIIIQPFKLKIDLKTLQSPLTIYEDLSEFCSSLKQYNIKLIFYIDLNILNTDLKQSLEMLNDYGNGFIFSNMKSEYYNSNYKEILKYTSDDKIFGMEGTFLTDAYQHLDLLIIEIGPSITSLESISGFIKTGNQFNKKPYIAVTSSFKTDSKSRNKFLPMSIMLGWTLVMNYGDELLDTTKASEETQPTMNWDQEKRNNGFSTASRLSSNLNTNFFTYGLNLQIAQGSDILSHKYILSLLTTYNENTLKWGNYKYYLDLNMIYLTVKREGFQSYLIIFPFHTKDVSKNIAKYIKTKKGIDVETGQSVNLENHFIDMNKTKIQIIKF